MHLSKLTHALKAFSEPQFKRLKDYVHSPFFKVPSASAALFDYLYPLYPSFAEKKLEPKAIARKAAKLATAAAQSWAGTELLHAIEQYIGLEHHRQNQPAAVLHQLHGFRELRLFEHFRKDYSHALQQLADCPEQHTDTFYHRHLFTELHFNERDLQRSTHAPSDITPAVTSLDEFYALKKLHYLCEALVRNQISEKMFPAKQITALLATLKPYNNPNYPCAYLLINIYHLLTTDTYRQCLPYYKLLKEYAVSQSAITNLQSPILPPPALADSIHYLVHHCLRWYNKGEEAAGKEYLWWVEIKMKYGWLAEDGKLKPVTFRNIATIAASYKHPEWLADFIVQSAPYLPAANLENNMSFAKGLLAYRFGKYKAAIRCFLTARAKDEPVFNCIIRRWQWICLYEYDQNDDTTLQNQLSSFEKYLYRNKEELGANVNPFDKFILYAAALLAPAQSKQATSLRVDLENETYFTGKHWLLKQAALKKQTTTSKKILQEA